MMTVSNRCYEFIKIAEGYRSKAYPDPASGGKPYTIGYGHTKGVKLGDTCTIPQANQWLIDDVAESIALIDRKLGLTSGHAQGMTQSMFEALVSFVFNIGRLGDDMTKYLQADDYGKAGSEIKKFIYASGKINSGLINRRGKEYALYIHDSPWLDDKKKII